MNSLKWTTMMVALGLGGTLLAACDEEPDDGTIELGDGPGSSSGGTEDPPGNTSTTASPETTGTPPAPSDEPEPCDQPDAARECVTEAGQMGTQFCDTDYSDGDAEQLWGPCLTSYACEPGTSRSCGDCPGGGDSGGECDIYEQCDLYGGVPDWDTNRDEWGGCNTPLVLSFDGSPARMTAAGAATFDLDGIGGCITTDWPEAATPWLALDRDGNGSIDSGRELFGSGTRLRSGARAPHGFAALAELDSNGDGRLTTRDDRFGELVLWADHDGDRRSTFAETEPLSSHRILGIELGFHIDAQCDERGNCGVERASFTFIDPHGAVREGEIVDLHLSCQ
ncbi:MAG: calcium-binding protein [Nannocystaceae bacterium]